MTLLVLDFEMPVMDTALPHKEALKKRRHVKTILLRKLLAQSDALSENTTLS